MTHRRQMFVVHAVQVCLALALVIWWSVTYSRGSVSILLLPSPGEVFGQLTALLRSPVAWANIRTTAFSFVMAFAGSCFFGLALGAAAGRSDYGAQLVGPPLVRLQTVPIVLLYPICVLAFGLGPMSKIVFAGIYGFLPIASGTIAALTTIDSKLVTLGQSLGATRRQMKWLILFPASAPVILSSIRIGAALNLIGVIAGEILGATSGIGYAIAGAGQTFRIGEMYAYIIIAIVFVAIAQTSISLTTRGGPRTL